MIKIKRLLSILLMIILTIQLLPSIAFADGTDISGIGTATGSGGGNGAGRWSTDRSGYRIYIIDKQGNPRSNVVDFLFSDPETLGLPVLYCVNTKMDDGLLRVGKDKRNKTVFIPSMNLNWYPTGTDWPTVIYYPKTEAVARGDQVKKWMLEGATLRNKHGTSGGGGTIGGYTGGKNNNSGTSKPSNSSGQNNSKPQDSFSVTGDYAKKLGDAMESALNSYKALGYSKLLAIEYAVFVGTEKYNQFYSLQIFSNVDLGLFRSILYVKEQEFIQVKPWIYTKGDPKNPFYKYYNSGEKDKDVDSEKKKDPNRDKDIQQHAIKNAYNYRQSQGFLTISYADTNTNDSKATENGNLLKILEYGPKDKKTATESDFVFKLQDTFGNPMSLNISQFRDSSGVEYTAKSVVETCCNNEFIIMIEPIFFMRPAKTSVKNSNGKWEPSGEADFIFYGTVTNYGQYNEWAKANGKWHDNGKGGHYATCFNGIGKVSMYIDKDLVTSKKTIKVPGNTSDNKVTNDKIADSTVGYALHYFYCKGGDGLPETPTYDTFTKNPNLTPHPAPNPDPTYPTPDSPYIPLTKRELPDPGDPITPDNPDPENKGYLNTTRTINIIKVYQLEDENGIIKHVTTEYQTNSPGKISVQHEPEYKVVGYFSSDLYLKDHMPLNESTIWDVFTIEVANKHDYADYADGTNHGGKEITWAEVEGRNNAGTELFHADLGTACLCGLSDTEKTGAIDYNDPTTIAKLETGEHWYDNTLYVRLLRKELPPETSTWDENNYPDVPGPAPDPTVTPEPGNPPVDPNNSYLNYRIVKVYEEEDQSTGAITHITTTERYPTTPIILIEDETDYDVVEWKYGDPYIPVDSSTQWNDPAIANVKADDSGNSTNISIDIRKKLADGTYAKDTETTLYVRLRKIIKMVPANPPSMSEDLTESQLTKISNTNSKEFNWADSFNFTASIEAAVLSHGYQLHVGCSNSSEDHVCTPCVGGCADTGDVCTHMKRLNADHVVWTEFSMRPSWKNSYETTVNKPSAHADFAGKMYGHGGLVSDTIKFQETNLDDSAHSTDWELGTLGTDGSKEKGIEYITTISRSAAGDKLNIAKYKKNAMDTTSYTRVNSIFPESNKPTGNRLANGIINTQIGYTIGYTNVDDKASSVCLSGCCLSHHIPPSPDVKTVQFNIREKTLSGAFTVFTYGGKQAKSATAAPSNIKNFNVQYSDGTSNNSALYIKQQSSTLKFFPYVKMSYMVTLDNISFPGYSADASQSNSRTVYMLSDKLSNILPTNSVEVSWYNKTQADGGYGLQMTSQQWSVHNKATQGSDGWQGVNQVLPGGALYSLATTGTESYIKTVTYNTLVENDSRIWIELTDPTKYTTQSIVKSTQDYLTEAKRVMENYRIVEWVNTDISLATAWDKESTAVKIAGGGESLAKLNLSTKASTDSKYLLFNGTDTNEKGASEADLDILREYYQTTVYHGFTDVNGDVYISQITVNTDIKMLDQATLDNVVGQLKKVTGTTINKSTIQGLPSNMTYSCVKIGSKTQTTSTIINNLMNNTTYNYLYQLDLKTKFITNLINSVERNTGDDTRNATWTTDGKWYNEAFDGYYEVVQTATYKMGIGAPSRRISVLDPNLCPAKASTGNIYTKAHLSQFCLDSKSTIAQNEDNGYVGTFEGTKVYLPSLETMYYTRPFYIPNANVQDLT